MSYHVQRECSSFSLKGCQIRANLSSFSINVFPYFLSFKVRTFKPSLRNQGQLMKQGKKVCKVTAVRAYL